MSDSSRKTKRSGSKQRQRDSYAKSGGARSSTSASASTSTSVSSLSSSVRRTRQTSKRSQKGSAVSPSACRHAGAPQTAAMLSPAAATDEPDDVPVSLIDSSSLISLCSPFVVPDGPHRVIPDRHANNTDIDLSVIYGPLDGKPLSGPASDYLLLARQKLLSTLLDNLSLIEDDDATLLQASSARLSIASSSLVGSSDDDDEDDDDDDDSDYDSNIDSDIDLIDEAILSSNTNQTILIPSLYDKPGPDLNEVRINNTPLF